MDINFFSENNVNESKIINFIISIKSINFLFKNKKHLAKYKKKNVLYFFSNDVKINQTTRSIKYCVDNNFHNILFFLPAKFQHKINNINIECLYYPILVNDLENALNNKFLKKEIFFGNISLFNENVLINTTSKNKVYLTEIESKIIKLLINKQNISKKTISANILKQHSSVDSKSLESHLYRLRKKLFEIDSKIEILAIDDKSIKIKKLTK